MASSFIITVKASRSDTDMISRIKKDTTSARGQARALEQYFKALAGGLDAASLDIQTSASAPVRASGTLTVVYATIANGSTVVIGGTTLTCVTGTPSGFSEFKKVTDLATTIANLTAAINGNTTLNKLVSAAVTAVGVVTITSLVPGVVGNQITLVGGTGATASASKLASGAGGAETTVATYSCGL